MQTDESGGLIPDEFGGAFGSKRDIGPSETGKKALGSSQGADLLSALVGGDQIGQSTDPQGRQGVEQIARQFDPSLQASQEVEDPNAPLSDAVLNQSFDAVNADLRTPRSHGSPLVSPEQADEYFTTLESAAGVPLGTVQRPTSPMAPSQLNSLGSIVSSLINNKADNLAKEQRQKEYNTKQKEMFELKADLSRELQSTGQQFSYGAAVALKGIGFDNQQRLDEGRASRRESFAREQAKTGFSNQLELFEKKATLTGEEGALNRESALVRAIVTGSQKIQAQDLAQLDKIALADQAEGTKRFDKHLDFYYKMVKAYPAITGDMAEILASVPPGTIAPATEEAIRGALNKEARDTFGNRSVESTLEAVTAGVWGGSAENKALALWSQSKLLQRQGVDTSLLDDALNYLDTKKSGQTININTGNPIKTAGEREDIAGFRSLLTNIDYIGSLYSPEYTGIADNLIAKGKSVFGLTGQREELFRSSVAEMKSTIARMRAGGAIGPAEERFLLEAIPDIGIPDSQFVARFQNFQRITKDMLGERYSLVGYTAKTRAEELELMGRNDPAEVERILVKEGLLEPRKRKGEK